MSDDDAAILPVRVSNRILARVNASSSVPPPAAVAEIGANARLAVVSPYVRHAAAGGTVQTDHEETDDADAPAAARGNEVLLSNGEVDEEVPGGEVDEEVLQPNGAAGADAPAAARGNEVLLSNGEVDEEVPGGEVDEEVLRPNGAAGAAINSIDDVPTEHICMIAGVPPADGVHFNISDSNAWAHGQVWSREMMFRMIATRGVGVAVREVVHPSTQERIARDRAWAHVTAVSPELQEILHGYRRDLGLSPEVEDPINDIDRLRYEQTMAAITSR